MVDVMTFWTSMFPSSARVVFASIVVLLLPLSGCDGPEERYAAYMERGKALFENAEYVSARLEFRNALKIRPHDVWALYYVALAAEADGHVQAAASGFRRAVGHHPRHVPTLIKASTYALISSNWEIFSAYLSTLKELAPENPEVLALEAGMLLNQGRVAEARALAEDAVSMAPGSESAVGVLASVHAATEDHQAVMEVLVVGLAHNPDSHPLRVLKLQTLYTLGQLDVAESLLRELVSVQPNQLAYLGELTNLLVQNGRLQEAEAEFGWAINSHPDNTNLQLMFVGFLDAHKGPGTAETQLIEFIARSPENVELQFALAAMQERQDKHTRAAATFRDILDKNGEGPISQRARNRLAKLLRVMGDPRGSRVLVDEVLVRDPYNVDALSIKTEIKLDDAESLSDAELDEVIADLQVVTYNSRAPVNALSRLAEAYVRKGLSADATETVRELLALAPLGAKRTVSLARLTAARGDGQGAMDLVDEVLAISPDEPDSLRLKASLGLRLGQWHDVEAAALRLAAIDGQEAFAHRALATVHVMREDYAAALETYHAVARLEPESPSAIEGVVRSMLALGRVDQALTYLDEATDNRGNSADLLVLKADCYAQIDQMGEAEEAYSKAIGLDPKSALAVSGLADLYVEAGEFGQAIKVYEQARTDRILDISSEHRLADAYLKMSDAARAISVYERILENGIEDNRAANNLAALVADYFPDDLDRLARARELTSAFDQSDNPYFLDTLGWVNHHLGNHLDAITYLERAVSARNIPQIHYHLGMAYQASGQPLPARMQLELALAGDPEPFIGIDDARETLNALRTEAQDL